MTTDAINETFGPLTHDDFNPIKEQSVTADLDQELTGTPASQVEGIRVNMTDKEATSADREVLPVGKFHYKFTDMEVKFVKEGSKNAGKPFIAFELTVQDGKYAARKDWTNAMCFDGALYTISQICKALGMDVPPNGGGFQIPVAREFYIGKDIWGRRGTQDKDRNEDGSLRIQLRGFSKYDGGVSEVAATGTPSSPTAKKGASVLP